MPDGNRGNRDQNLAAAFGAIALFAAVALAFLIGDTLGIGSGRGEVTAHQNYEDAKQDAMQSCIGLQDRALMECVAKAYEATYEKSDSHQDLYAQQDMSKWAFWLLILTAITVGITALGVWFVKRTLDATLEAVDDTSKATKAMKRANEIAQSIADAELRPYLFVDKVEVVDRRTWDSGEFDEDGEPLPGAFAARVVIWLRNFGKVPARNVKVYIKEYFARQYAGEFWGYKFDIVELPICAPSHVRRVFGTIFVPTIYRDDWDIGGMHRFIRLRITFEDSYGNEFTEKAAYFLSGDDLETAYLITDTSVAKWRERYQELSEEQDDLFG